MSFFEFPHTRTYDSDLGWLIWAMKKLIGDMEEFTEINSIKFGDPINWNIATQYEPTTIVVDDDGNGYISRQAVPAGIALTDTNYWTQIFNFGDITDTIREGIAVNNGDSATALQAMNESDLIWWNGKMYQVLYDIAAGTALIVDTNVKLFTVDDKINSIVTVVADEVQARESEDAALATAIATEVATRESETSTLQTGLADETTARIAEDERLEDMIEQGGGIADRVQINDGQYFDAFATFMRGTGIAGVYDVKLSKETAYNIIGNTYNTQRNAAKDIEALLLVNGPLAGPLMNDGEYSESTWDGALYYVGWNTPEDIQWTSIQNGWTRSEIVSMGRYGFTIWSPIMINGVKWTPTQAELDQMVDGNTHSFGDYIYYGKHPRTVLAVDQDDYFHFIVFSGRYTSIVGADYQQLYDYVSQQGYKHAFNLDGGGNSCMFSGTRRITPPNTYVRRTPGWWIVAKGE